MKDGAGRTAAWEFRTGWPTLAGATLGLATGALTVFYFTQGLFFAPLGEAFGWTRSQLSMTNLIGAVEALVDGPGVVGRSVGGAATEHQQLQGHEQGQGRAGQAQADEGQGDDDIGDQSRTAHAVPVDQPADDHRGEGDLDPADQVGHR